MVMAGCSWGHLATQVIRTVDFVDDLCNGDSVYIVKGSCMYPVFCICVAELPSFAAFRAAVCSCVLGIVPGLFMISGLADSTCLNPLRMELYWASLCSS